MKNSFCIFLPLEVVLNQGWASLVYIWLCCNHLFWKRIRSRSNKKKSKGKNCLNPFCCCHSHKHLKISKIFVLFLRTTCVVLTETSQTGFFRLSKSEEEVSYLKEQLWPTSSIVTNWKVEWGNVMSQSHPNSSHNIVFDSMPSSSDQYIYMQREQEVNDL